MDGSERRTNSHYSAPPTDAHREGYLASWLERYASVHLKPSTAEDYRQLCEGHLFSAIGDRLLHTVTRAEVKRMIGQLLAKGLKKRPIHNILTPLKEAPHHAMDEQLVSSNPVTKLRALCDRQRRCQRAYQSTHGH